MARNVQLGHAKGAGVGRNGAPGDQSGEEVKVTKWNGGPDSYGGWYTLIRCKDKEIAKAVAKIDERLCESGKVGYNQKKRNTLYYALKKYNFDVDAYLNSGEYTDTDCSAYVYTLYCCKIKKLRDWMCDPDQAHGDAQKAKQYDDRGESNSTWNGNLEEVFKKYGDGKFEIYGIDSNHPHHDKCLRSPNYANHTKYADYEITSQQIRDSKFAEVGDIYNYYVNKAYQDSDGTWHHAGHAVLVVSTDGSASTLTTKAPSNTTTTYYSSSGTGTSSGGFGNRVRNISAATNITGTTNNTVQLLGSVSDSYKDQTLAQSSNRLDEFKALKNKLSGDANSMGMDIYLPEELFDTNILKSSKQSKTLV